MIKNILYPLNPHTAPVGIEPIKQMGWGIPLVLGGAIYFMKCNVLYRQTSMILIGDNVFLNYTNYILYLHYNRKMGAYILFMLSS